MSTVLVEWQTLTAKYISIYLGKKDYKMSLAYGKTKGPILILSQTKRIKEEIIRSSALLKAKSQEEKDKSKVYI